MVAKKRSLSPLVSSLIKGARSVLRSMLFFSLMARELYIFSLLFLLLNSGGMSSTRAIHDSRYRPLRWTIFIRSVKIFVVTLSAVSGRVLGCSLCGILTGLDGRGAITSTTPPGGELKHPPIPETPTAQQTKSLLRIIS